MNHLIDEKIPQTDEIVVRMSFVDGDTFTQNVPVSKADLVEELLDWYRFRPNVETYSFNYGVLRKVKVFSRHHIMAIEIDNYIELTRTSYKWYEKLWDKVRTKLYFANFKLKRCGKNG